MYYNLNEADPGAQCARTTWISDRDCRRRLWAAWGSPGVPGDLSLALTTNKPYPFLPCSKLTALCHFCITLPLSPCEIRGKYVRMRCVLAEAQVAPRNWSVDITSAAFVRRSIVGPAPATRQVAPRVYSPPSTT